jgi:hypothetical protein
MMYIYIYYFFSILDKGKNKVTTFVTGLIKDIG